MINSFHFAFAIGSQGTTMTPSSGAVRTRNAAPPGFRARIEKASGFLVVVVLVDGCRELHDGGTGLGNNPGASGKICRDDDPSDIARGEVCRQRCQRRRVDRGRAVGESHTTHQPRGGADPRRHPKADKFSARHGKSQSFINLRPIINSVGRLSVIPARSDSYPSHVWIEPRMLSNIADRISGGNRAREVHDAPSKRLAETKGGCSKQAQGAEKLNNFLHSWVRSFSCLGDSGGIINTQRFEQLAYQLKFTRTPNPGNNSINLATSVPSEKPPSCREGCRFYYLNGCPKRRRK